MTYRLMTPGPVPVPASVLQALAQPILHHRTPEFEQILGRVLKRLPSIFQTTERAYMHASTGSGAMESAVVNTLSPGDEALCICAGKFGERWAEIAEIYGVKVHRLEVPWGEDLDLNQVENILTSSPDIRVVMSQACETSTGAWLPVERLAKLVQTRPQTILMIDAITALGAVPMPMDEWGVDVVIGGSQKGLMLPTGLSFLAFSKKAWGFVEKARCPRFYWDMRQEKKANEKSQTFFSSPVSLILALDAVLSEFEQRGLSWFHKRAEKLAHATREGARILGCEIFPRTPSSSLSCLTVPSSVDSQKLRTHMEATHQVTIMGGQDQLTGQVIRIGHMGEISNDDAVATIRALGLSLQNFMQLDSHVIEKAVLTTQQALVK